MKKKINLQMFADAADGAPAAAADATATADTKADKKAADTKAADTKATDAAAEKKYTDAEVDEIVKSRLARAAKEQQKAVEEAKAKEKEAAKLEKMDAQQKAEYQLSEANKKIAEYERKETLAEMTKTARKMLSDKNISVSDDVLAMLVNTNAEETKAAIEGFAKAFDSAVEAKVKERLKGAPPKTSTGVGVTAMTKEQILAIKDSELRQKKMLEHKHLFNL